MKHAMKLLLAGATVSVAACGGGGGDSTSSNNTPPPTTPTAPTTPTNPPITPTDPPVTYSFVGTAVSNGETLVARRSVGIELTYGGGATELVQPPEVKVRRAANGELEFDLNGVKHSFEITDRVFDNGYDVDVDPDPNVFGDEYSLFIRTSTIDDLLSPGGNWHEIVMTQSTIVNAGTPALRSFAVIGSPTADVDLPQLGTATYSGTAFAEFYPEAGYVNNFTSRTELRSQLDMSVNFESTKISGALSGIEEKYPTGIENAPGPWLQVDGTWQMQETDFAASGFTGNIAADGAYNGALSLSGTSTYSGAFFGPTAEEIGGTLSLTGTAAAPAIGGAFNGIGAFTGSKN
jgi:hypothetical protein